MSSKEHDVGASEVDLTTHVGSLALPNPLTPRDY